MLREGIRCTLGAKHLSVGFSVNFSERLQWNFPFRTCQGYRGSDK